MKTTEDILKQLDERITKLETRRDTIEWQEHKILEICHNIVRLKTGNFYIENGKQTTVHKTDIEMYIKSMETSLKSAINDLQWAKCD